MADHGCARALRGLWRGPGGSPRPRPGVFLALRETEDEMRLRSMAIFGIGYLVGTRAGRDRYQQIAESVREVAESDVVRG